MAEYLLETKDLGISFGGLKAAQNVNLRIKKNQIYGLIGPNGAGKTTIFNLLTCVYKPTAGTFFLNGEEIKRMSPDKINVKGIARTFQNIRLFNNMTVVRNVMVGLANQPEYKCSVLERNCCGSLIWSRNATVWHATCPTASSASWKSPALWQPIPRFCCWTSLLPA